MRYLFARLAGNVQALPLSSRVKLAPYLDSLTVYHIERMRVEPARLVIFWRHR